ncbi:MAG: glycosyltransferase [Planctomycetes bacterium]|nr:glycosyltransferase [Planctomycetota bacterium]
MRRLSTLHLNTERTWRGGERQTLYLAEGLCARGHLARVLCRADSELGRRARASGLEVIEMTVHGELDVVAGWRIARHVRREGYDILHMHTSHAHGLGILASALCRGPRRVVHRRVDFSIFRNRLRISRFKYRLGVDRYVAISAAVKAAMVADGIAAERIAVVPSGVDTARLDRIEESPAAVRRVLGLELDWPVVGCVAHLAWHKGQEFLVRAAPRLIARVPEVRILIVGEGPRRAALEAEIRALGVGDRVRLTGFRADVLALVRALDVLAMPSVMEGLNTTLLDAQALGIPVVATRVGGIPEAVADGEGGVLVPPRDPAALAEALADLCADPARRAALGQRGRAWVRERFSVDRMVEGVLAVYRELVE